MTTDVALAPTDDELVHRFAQGDDNAFVALDDRSVDRIYDFTARLLGDREAADATQETLLKALTALRERPPQGVCVHGSSRLRVTWQLTSCVVGGQRHFRCCARRRAMSGSQSS